MLLNIVEKALYYCDSEQVFVDKITNKGFYFQVGIEGISEPTDNDPVKMVSFRNDGKGWVHSCTCTHGSNQGKAYGCICSHIVACIIYLGRNQKLVKKRMREMLETEGA